MEYRRLGKTGLKVSTISLGAWLTYGSDDVEFATAEACIRTAIENGINFIDVADAYAGGKAEETVGKIIQDYTRSDLVISSKAYWPMSENINDRGLSRKHLFESVEKSLKRFNTDYLDLFFCHRYDNESPTDETVRALDDLVRQGKVLYWGTSMWKAHQIYEAVDSANRYNAYAPVVEQPVYNMLERTQLEGDLETAVRENGMGVVVFSPLAQGLLTGKYNDGVPEDSRASNIKSFRNRVEGHDFDRVRELTKLANEMGVTPAALALAWAIRHPLVNSVITGATKTSHVDSNIKALEVEITDEIETKIEEILQNRPENSQR